LKVDFESSCWVFGFLTQADFPRHKLKFKRFMLMFKVRALVPAPPPRAVGMIWVPGGRHGTVREGPLGGRACSASQWNFGSNVKGFGGRNIVTLASGGEACSAVESWKTTGRRSGVRRDLFIRDRTV